MGKRCDLSSTVVAKVDALLSSGKFSIRQIATLCNIHHASVINIKKRITAGVPSTSRVGRCGPKRKTTEQDDRIMVRMIRKDNLLSAKQVQGQLVERGINISARTVRRRLNEAGCKSVKPIRKPKLTSAMKLKRLQFARQYLNKPIEFWRTVCFSDETIFECQSATRRRVWQTPGSQPVVREAVKHPTKVMFWGVISSKGPGRLHIVDGMMEKNQYMNVLSKRMLPQLLEWFGSTENCVFMHDSAPCHKARVVTQFLETNHINVLPWPGNSPDLNPIENIWGIMKEKLSQITHTTKDQLISSVLRNWFRDDEFQQKLQNSIDSMPRRLQAVVNAKGGQTKY